MPRFVLLEHNHPVLHWDFMLESGPALRTWRLDRVPSRRGTLSAQPLPDHRLAYLDYEGPVSGNRGEVKRVDGGEFETLAETPAQWRVRVHGQQLSGVATIETSADGSCVCHWEPEPIVREPATSQHQ